MALAFHDGAFIDKNDIKISLADYGFNRGLAFFETMRVYGGVPFHMSEHVLRMEHGARALGLELPLAVREIESAVQQLVAQNKFPHSTIKFYFTAGESHASPYSLAAEHDFTPHLFIVEDEMKPDHPEAPYGLEFYRRGQKIKTVNHERALPHVKSISYLQAYYAAREAGPEWDDVLFTHHEGYITEATRANFFCVIEGVLSTPHENILDGVTRRLILDIAKETGIPVAERRLTPEDLNGASEAFTTGSSIEMVPVRQINAHMLPTTMDGPVFRLLRQGYTDKIRNN